MTPANKLELLIPCERLQHKSLNGRRLDSGVTMQTSVVERALEILAMLDFWKCSFFSLFLLFGILLNLCSHLNSRDSFT